MRPLLLSSQHASLARRSGYQLLAEYLPDAKLLSAPRRDPAGRFARLGAQLLRRGAFSRWYLGGSAALEWQALRELRRGDYGLVHSLWADLDWGYLDFFVRDRPLVATFHQCADALPQTIRFPGRARRFAAVILMSETQRPFFREAGVPSEKIRVILHGVDTASFQPAPSTERERFTVLSVGSYRRDFPRLRAICAEAPWQFVIIAPAAAREIFAGLENVEFRSNVTDAELLAQYQTASCLLHVAENATANNALLEALACGLPIVAERIGGVAEYATEPAAALVPAGDTAGLMRALGELATSPAKRDGMRLAARARAEELDWRHVAARTREVYASAA